MEQNNETGSNDSFTHNAHGVPFWAGPPPAHGSGVQSHSTINGRPVLGLPRLPHTFQPTTRPPQPPFTLPWLQHSTDVVPVVRGSHREEADVPHNSPLMSTSTESISHEYLNVPELLLGGSSNRAGRVEDINEITGANRTSQRVTVESIREWGLPLPLFLEFFDIAVNSMNNGIQNEGSNLRLNNIDDMHVQLMRAMIREGDFGDLSEFRESLRREVEADTNPRPTWMPLPRPSDVWDPPAPASRNSDSNTSESWIPTSDLGTSTQVPDEEYSTLNTSSSIDTATSTGTDSTIMDYTEMPPLMDVSDSSDDGFSTRSATNTNSNSDANPPTNGATNGPSLWYAREPWVHSQAIMNDLLNQGRSPQAAPSQSSGEEAESQYTSPFARTNARWRNALQGWNLGGGSQEESTQDSPVNAARLKRAKKVLGSLEALDKGLLERYCKLGDDACPICFGRLTAGSLLVDEKAASDEDVENTEKDQILTENVETGVVALPCAHVFHSQCILPWFANRNRATTCPACRFDLDPHKLLSDVPSFIPNDLPWMDLNIGTSPIGDNEPSGAPSMNIDRSIPDGVPATGSSILASLGNSNRHGLRASDDNLVSEPENRSLPFVTSLNSTSSVQLERDYGTIIPRQGRTPTEPSLPTSSDDVATTPSAPTGAVFSNTTTNTTDTAPAIDSPSISNNHPPSPPPPVTAEFLITAYREASETMRTQHELIATHLEALHVEQERLLSRLDSLGVSDIRVRNDDLQRDVSSLMADVGRRIQNVRRDVESLTARTNFRRELEMARPDLRPIVGDRVRVEWKLPTGSLDGGIKAWIEKKEKDAQSV